MKRPLRFTDEDRAAYARLVDEAMASEEIRGLLRHSALDRGKLRTGALGAGPAVAAAAREEYEEFAALRRAAGNPAALSGPAHQERSSAGASAVLAVLVPVLSFAAAATFLLLGWGIRVTKGDATVAEPLITTGWSCLVLAVLSAAAACVALLRTALAHRAPGPRTAPAPELLRAREAWLTALRDRGVMPYLRSRLQAGGTTPPDPGKPAAHHRPAWDSPSFTSPGAP
ncbi:hypothetical protein ACFYVL_34410 [Streptomyces sp. NPDC004111]|uniref:hypothetical protein n=1 Tax=Streptomyces sp. NPDC004111 TaxID=3364690 RepID=UPI00367925D5